MSISTRTDPYIEELEREVAALREALGNPKECPACWGNGFTFDHFDDKVDCDVCASTGKVYALQGKPQSFDGIVYSHKNSEGI